MIGQIKVGKVTGTGSAINISLGGVPQYVKVYNNNDAGSLWATMEWWNGMADASALKCQKVIDNGATGLASQAKVATNGISAYAGSSTAAPGFTVGADADINAASEDFFYVAVM
jgi:hypothetical protein